MKFTIFNRQSEIKNNTELIGPITPQKSAEILEEIERKYGRESNSLGCVAKAMARFLDSRLTHAQGRRRNYEFTEMEAIRQMNKGLQRKDDREIANSEVLGPYKLAPEIYKKIRQEMIETDVKMLLEKCRNENLKSENFSKLMATMAILNGASGFLNFKTNENAWQYDPVAYLHNYLWFINQIEVVDWHHSEYINWIKICPEYYLFSFEEFGTSKEELRSIAKKYAKKCIASLYEKSELDKIRQFIKANWLSFDDLNFTEQDLDKKIKDKKEAQENRKIERAKTVKEVEELLKTALAKLEKFDGDLARTNLKLMI
jgi:hypothetical protein